MAKSLQAKLDYDHAHGGVRACIVAAL